jgi:hypothetical protein
MSGNKEVSIKLSLIIFEAGAFTGLIISFITAPFETLVLVVTCAVFLCSYFCDKNGSPFIGKGNNQQINSKFY